MHRDTKANTFGYRYQMLPQRAGHHKFLWECFGRNLCSSSSFVHIQWSFAHNFHMFNSPVELLSPFFFSIPDVQNVQRNRQTILQLNKICRLERRICPLSKSSMITQFTVNMVTWTRFQVCRFIISVKAIKDLKALRQNLAQCHKISILINCCLSSKTRLHWNIPDSLDSCKQMLTIWFKPMGYGGRQQISICIWTLIPH